MKNKIWLIFVFLCIISGMNYQCSDEPILVKPPPQWSEPVLFYSNPDSYRFIRYAADVNAGTMNVVTSFSIFENNLNKYSGIYLLRKEPGRKLDIKKLSQDNIPSEWPSILRDRYDKLHFIWGDRRQDPEFTIAPWQLMVYSTDVIYFNHGADEPEHIYAGPLSRLPVIVPPISLTEDNQGNLHAVFRSIKLLPDADGNPTEYGMAHCFYMNKSKNGQWSSPQYLAHGGQPEVVSLPGGRLLVVNIGMDWDNPLPSTDVLSTSSHDGGISWSDPVPLSMKSDNDLHSVDLIKESDEKLHLIVGRSSNAFNIEEIWHSLSNDGGISWSEPEMIHILDHLLINVITAKSDSYGHLHLILYGIAENNLWYGRMSPKTGQWEDLTKLDFAFMPGWSSLAFDKAANELYLFWTSREDPEQEVFYYSKKSVR